MARRELATEVVERSSDRELERYNDVAAGDWGARLDDRSSTSSASKDLERGTSLPDRSTAPPPDDSTSIESRLPAPAPEAGSATS